MKEKNLLLCSVLLAFSSLGADIHSPGEERPYDEQFPPKPTYPLPWFTGPLLAPSGHVIPVGHINFEPYFFVNVDTGTYNSHWKSQSAPNFYNLATQLFTQVGIFNRVDFGFTPQFSWNHVSGASHWEFNDMPVVFDVQLLYDTPDTWAPAIKFSLRGTIPFGNYQKLNPQKKETDIGGSGNWNPGVGLTFSRLFHFSELHYLAARWAFIYTVPNAVYVKGYNAYGGGFGTRGKVYPGPSFFSDIGLEYSLSQNWALALDIVYAHNNHTRFKGRRGCTDGMLNSVGGPSSESFSLAPAFEYNWSENYGLIAGVWFSIAGRNTAEFVNGVIAINIYQ